MGMKMKELPMSERPYEKLEMYGPKALSNAELLAIIIKSGTREESSVMLAQQILNLNQSKKDRNEAYKIVDIALGATNFAAIEPRHILRQAIKYDAQRFILVHNHPNGTPNPSKEDFRITDRIVEACMDIGMELIDHIIIGKDTYRSVLYMQKMKKYWS